MISTRTALHSSAIFVALSLIPVSALAQSGPASENAPLPTPVATVAKDDVVLVTARRRDENVQDIPVAVSVIDATRLAATGTYSIAQVANYQPSIQFISSNPRNTAVNIRGLGSSFGLANDGLEQGVGVYVDDVYYARPASTTFDLIDIARIEILRGPQGTLFGKNTTAGALNIVTKKPSFDPAAQIEASIGDYGFAQAKATLTGPLIVGKVAGRLALSTTDRDGLIVNTVTGQRQNDQNNKAVRGQVLILPSATTELRLIADFAQQNLNCCTQVFVRFGPSLRPANQQLPALSAALNYTPASLNPYDRLSDVNSAIQANQKLWGTSATFTWDIGDTTFTSVSAYRKWDWRPANDRDYTALSIRTASANRSRQNQISQELRLSSNGKRTVDWVVGLYAFHQNVTTNGLEEWGSDAARWLIGSSVPANLLTGYQARTFVRSETGSYAAFGQVNWNITERLRATTGVRYTAEDKNVSFDQTVSGGLATTDANLIARKLGIARPQTYAATLSDGSPSGLLSLSYDLTPAIMAYGSFAKGFKSGGINAAGIPTDAAGNPALISALIKPEDTSTAELGLKTSWLDNRVILNAAFYRTEVRDYQANVVDNGPGALRGYLANIERVDVNGAELEGRAILSPVFSVFGTLSWTDGRYGSFRNGPCPLELTTASTTSCDLSGKRLPGVSKWAGAVGGEARWPQKIYAISGEAYFNADAAFRSDFYSDASVSTYSLIEGSTVVNARLGFESEAGTEVALWAKNLFDTKALAFTSVQAGNSGAIFGQPIDPRTVGFTVKRAF